MNSVQLIGNACHELKLTKTKNGLSRCAFKIAVDKRGKKRGTDVFEVIAWRSAAEILSKYLKKGEKIGISGYLEHQEWDGDDGARYQDTVVVASTFTFCGRAEAQDEMDAATGETASGAGEDAEAAR